MSSFQQKFNRRIYLFLFSGIILFPLFIYGQEKLSSFKDDSCYFSVEIPDSWYLEQAVDNTSYLRLKIVSPDKKSMFSIYCLKTKGGDVDLKKLSQIDTKLFKNLGTLISNSSKGWFSKKIEKTYRNGDLYTNLIFRSSAFVGYILVYRSLSKDRTHFLEIERHFKTNVPFLKAAKNRTPKPLVLFKQMFMKLIWGLLLFAIPVGIILISAYIGKKNKTLYRILLVLLPAATTYFLWRFTHDIWGPLGGGFILLLLMVIWKAKVLIWFE